MSEDRLAGEIFQPRLLYCSPIVGFTVNVPKKVESFNSPVGGISESRLPLLQDRPPGRDA